MAAKKPQPEGIPLEQLVREHIKLPAHRRKLHREAQKGVVSTDGSTRLYDDELLSVVEAGLNHRDAQRQKAQKPRGAGDDGRTTRQVVADVVKGHDIEAKPDDLLPHVHAALDANGNNAITDKWARELMRLELTRLGRSSKRRT